MSAVGVAWIGLGSNLGAAQDHDPEADALGPAAQLQAALAALSDEPGVRLLAVSSFYRSVPVGGPPGQPMFCNAAAALATDLAPLALLDRLQAIEAGQGRRRTVRWGPRTLDLDILAFDDRRMDEPRLILPHPRAAERAFVLRPLADIAPALLLDGRRVIDRLAALDATGVEPWTPP